MFYSSVILEMNWKKGNKNSCTWIAISELELENNFFKPQQLLGRVVVQVVGNVGFVVNFFC